MPDESPSGQSSDSAGAHAVIGKLLEPSMPEVPSGPSFRQKVFHSANGMVAGFGIIMLIGLTSLAFIGRPPQAKLVGEKLPLMDLQPMLNVSESFSNDSLQGRLTVVHFWGTWCPPCQKEFPEFAELASEFAENDDVRILCVSCSPEAELDLPGLREKTAQFLQEYGSPIPTYSDATAMSRHRFTMVGGSFGYPTTVLADREGTIIDAVLGYQEGALKKLAQRIRDSL